MTKKTTTKAKGVAKRPRQSATRAASRHPAKRSAKRNKAGASTPTAGLPAPGTTLRRTFKGKEYKLRAVADGFRLGSTTYRSLTAAAKAVTKYPSVNGRLFWLGKAAAGDAKAASKGGK